MKLILISAGFLLLFAVSYAKTGDKKDGPDPKDKGPGRDDENMGPYKELELHHTRVKVNGKSGKIRLWKEDMGGYDNSSSQTNRSVSKYTAPIFVLFDALVEVDKADKPIEGEKSAKHSLKTFSQQDFEFSDVTVGELPYSEPTLNAKYFSYSGKLSGLSSSMETKVYVVSGTGNVSIDGEHTPVSRGLVKFTVSLSDWQWCEADTCDGAVGQALDMVIALGVPPKRMVKEARAQRPGKKFDLGEKAFIEFSSKIKIDGTWQDMPEGYPKYEVKGTKTLFTLRFPRFNQTAEYDPLADSGDVYVSVENLPDEDNYDPGSNSTSGAPAAALSLASLLTVVMAAFLQRH